jgi:glutamyl-tRNA reductase
VVVAATAAPTPVLSAPLPVPAGTRVLVVDAGFPRQVDPRLAAGGVEVVSLEALTSAADAAASERQAAVPAVERLVEEQVAQWLAWCDSAPLEHAIKALHAEAAQMTREAADALAAAASLPAEQVERLLRASVRGLLHGHVTRLRSLQGGRAA